MKRLITAAAISVTLFTAGCSSDSTPASQADPIIVAPSTEVAFDGGLLVNAGFKDGGEGWFGNAVNVMDDGSGSNNINFASVAAAGNSYDVNLSQILEIVPGKTYALSFKAKSDAARTILAGIGLNSGSYANNSETVSLTAEWKTYTLTLTADGFGDDNSRVLFDMGADTGEVWLDDVSLKETTATTPELSQIDLPVTFDESDVDYSVTDFGGAVSTLVTDPVDATNMVIKTIKAGDAKTWAGTTVGNDVADVAGDGGLATAIPFTATATTMSVRIYSPDAGIPVRLKVERSDDDTVTAETDTLTTVANEWETLVFDLNNVGVGTRGFDAAAGYDKASIFFNFDVAGETVGEKTYYWDDVKFGGETTTTPAASAPTTSAPIPAARTASDVISVYGEAYTATAGLNYNPDWGQSGLNNLNDSYNPGDGDLSLGYVNFNYQGTELAAIDASAMEYLHVDIWVPEGTDRLVKVSPINNGTGAVEVLVTVPVTPGSWNSVDLPKSAFTGMTWDSVLQMKFDGQFNGDGSANTESFDVYLDNIYFYKTGGDTTPPDDGDTNLVSEGDFATAGNWTSDNGSINIIDDNGNTVNSATIPDGTATPDAPWNRNFQQVIPITQGKSYTVTFRAKSDRSRSIFVGIGLNEDPWTNVKESAALTTEWQDFEVTLTATDFGGDLNRVFFELAGEDGLVLVDDISIVETEVTVTPPQTGTGSVVLPVTFEDAELAYTWTDFDGGKTTIIDNPQTTGNTSTKVTQLVKGEGQSWAGSTLILDTAVDFTQGDMFTMNFWSASLKPVLLKLEGSLGDVEITANHSGGGTWESLAFDFTNLTSSLGDVVKMTVIVENGAAGDGSADWTFYVDDIEQSVAEGSGIAGVTMPVDFESDDLTYSLTDFDGGAATVIDNPQTTGNSSAKVVQLIKNAGAGWAGSLLTLDSAIDFSKGEAFTMNFWSASAKSVLLKFEGTGGNAEVSANHNGGNVWEPLSFDFSGQTATLGNVVKVVMIVDLGNEGDGSAAWTFYADDIAQSVVEPSSALTAIKAGVNDAAAATWSFGQTEALNKVSVSTSTTAYEGTESLRFVHNGDQDWGGFYTVFSPVLNQSSKTNLVFALSNVPATASYLGVKLESDGVGTDAQLNILSYTPATMGIWDVYSIPFSDFTMFNGGFNPANIKAIGFWNPTSSGESAPPYVAVDILIDGINFE